MRVVMLVFALLLLLSYISLAINPAKAWYMTALGLLYVPLVLVNLLLLFSGIRRMSKSFLIPLIALLPSLVFIGHYVQFESGAVEPEGTTVKLVSYNVGRYIQGRRPEFKGKGGREVCIDSVTAFLRKTDADIICLQEVSLSGEYNVATYLKQKFPDYNSCYYMFVTDKGTWGNITLSRFPITGKGRMDFDQSSNQAVFCDIKAGERSIRVYNCHLESYNISLAGLLKRSGKDLAPVKDAERKMKRSILVRPAQVEQIAADIEECPADVIVTGDFNDNPMSYTYSRLMKGEQDTFVEAGKGLGATYSLLWPLIRIDYILIPDHYGAVSHHTPRSKCSDHYPVVAEFNVRGE
ncbi:MAG: endonuclease/exonuclease/phosphatase family protein [Candidatus Cryptobacteroides sp.]